MLFPSFNIHFWLCEIYEYRDLSREVSAPSRCPPPYFTYPLHVVILTRLWFILPIFLFVKHSWRGVFIFLILFLLFSYPKVTAFIYFLVPCIFTWQYVFHLHLYLYLYKSIYLYRYRYTHLYQHLCLYISVCLWLHLYCVSSYTSVSPYTYIYTSSPHIYTYLYISPAAYPGSHCISGDHGSLERSNKFLNMPSVLSNLLTINIISVT